MSKLKYHNPLSRALQALTVGFAIEWLVWTVADVVWPTWESTAHTMGGMAGGFACSYLWFRHAERREHDRLMREFQDDARRAAGLPEAPADVSNLFMPKRPDDE